MTNAMQSSKQLAVDCMACQNKTGRTFVMQSAVTTTIVTGAVMDGKETLPNLHLNRLGQLMVGKRMVGMTVVLRYVVVLFVLSCFSFKLYMYLTLHITG